MSVGIQETKEVIEAANELTLVVVKHVKDGVSVSDIPAIVSELVSSDEFRQTLTKAVTGVTNVPSEIKDVDFVEGMELAKIQLSYVPKIIEALRK